MVGPYGALGDAAPTTLAPTGAAPAPSFVNIFGQVSEALSQHGGEFAQGIASVVSTFKPGELEAAENQLAAARRRLSNAAPGSNAFSKAIADVEALEKTVKRLRKTQKAAQEAYAAGVAVPAAAQDNTMWWVGGGAVVVALMVGAWYIGKRK